MNRLELESLSLSRGSGSGLRASGGGSRAGVESPGRAADSVTVTRPNLPQAGRHQPVSLRAAAAGSVCSFRPSHASAVTPGHRHVTVSDRHGDRGAGDATVAQAA